MVVEKKTKINMKLKVKYYNIFALFIQTRIFFFFFARIAYQHHKLKLPFEKNNWYSQGKPRARSLSLGHNNQEHSHCKT